LNQAFLGNIFMKYGRVTKPVFVVFVLSLSFICACADDLDSVRISKPIPADGSEGIVADNVVLSWSEVPKTSSYIVYIGASPDKLALAAKVKQNTCKSNILEVFTDYYWQVIAEQGREQVKGPVWRFKTAQKAFPSAEGFGKFTPGGRGGRVLKVTNLNDSGPGSLRAAIETPGPRIIVFDVAGNVMLKSALRIKEPYLTVAGQTASGDGVAVVGNETRILTHDVIIRYMRFRATDLAGVAIDAINDGQDEDNATRFILDHCTASWGIDETLSICKEAICTVQWCLVSESFCESIHRKGAHGYGGIWGGITGSFHHNLLAHHSSRNPRFDGGIDGHQCLIDYRNNVVYNWGFNSSYGAEEDHVNMVNNYYKAGPATRKSCANRIYQAQDPNARMYINGNYVVGFPEISQDNWAGGVHFKHDSAATIKDIRVDQPFDVVAVPTTSAEQAYVDVLAKVGAVFPARDSLDERIVNEVRTGTAKYGKSGNGIIDSQFDLCPERGKCPRCLRGDYCWLPKLKSAETPQDADSDGMPDTWERQHQLDPADGSDGSKDCDSDGYTNIEEYINSLAARI
jgi:hypothetical protein